MSVAADLLPFAEAAAARDGLPVLAIPKEQWLALRKELAAQLRFDPPQYLDEAPYLSIWTSRGPVEVVSGLMCECGHPAHKGSFRDIEHPFDGRICCPVSLYRDAAKEAEETLVMISPDNALLRLLRGNQES